MRNERVESPFAIDHKDGFAPLELHTEEEVIAYSLLSLSKSPRRCCDIKNHRFRICDSGNGCLNVNVDFDLCDTAVDLTPRE